MYMTSLLYFLEKKVRKDSQKKNIFTVSPPVKYKHVFHSLNNLCEPTKKYIEKLQNLYRFYER